MKVSQKKLILARLQEGRMITPLEALLWFGCFRLGARIYDLRKEGYPIQTKLSKDGYAIYFMN